MADSEKKTSRLAKEFGRICQSPMADSEKKTSRLVKEFGRICQSRKESYVFVIFGMKWCI